MNKQQAIKDMIEYIDKHYLKHKYTPSLRDIEAELGFSRQTALRYLQELDKQGVLKYDGKTIITQRIAQLTTDDTVRKRGADERKVSLDTKVVGALGQALYPQSKRRFYDRCRH